MIRIPIEVVPMDALRAYIAAALDEQSYTDARGVLGVPVSHDGHQWKPNQDHTAIRDLVETAVVLTWTYGDLEIQGRFGDPLHVRLFRASDKPGQARPAPEDDVAVRAGDCSQIIWEVTDPAGHVMVRAGIELADCVYREISPEGSHLHHAPAPAALVVAA
jgi:hypothetical protein